MKKFIYGWQAVLLIIAISVIINSCQKTTPIVDMKQEQSISTSANVSNRVLPHFNLEVILRGHGKEFGLIKFRQDVDLAKIVTLDIWVRNLAPNHSYSLQRAVDMINVVDGNCTSTSWLTLGKGLVSQMITTDGNGTGKEELWRSVAAIASGSRFDIHFRVIDAVTSAVMLTSDCYQYTVR